MRNTVPAILTSENTLLLKHISSRKENMQINKSAQNKQLERVPATYALVEVFKDVKDVQRALLFSSASVVDCVIYYVTGYCRNL